MNLAQAFPSLWDFLIPNLNIVTVIGGGILLLGILILVGFFTSVISGNVSVLKNSFSTVKVAVAMIVIGVIMVWGTSIAIDFVSSPGGYAIVVGIAAVIFVWFLLFWQPKNKDGATTKLF